jgi:hypothetical protein
MYLLQSLFVFVADVARKEAIVSIGHPWIIQCFEVGVGHIKVCCLQMLFFIVALPLSFRSFANLNFSCSSASDSPRCNLQLIATSTLNFFN